MRWQRNSSSLHSSSTVTKFPNLGNYAIVELHTDTDLTFRRSQIEGHSSQKTNQEQLFLERRRATLPFSVSHGRKRCKEHPNHFAIVRPVCDHQLWLLHCSAQEPEPEESHNFLLDPLFLFSGSFWTGESKCTFLLQNCIVYPNCVPQI